MRTFGINCQDCHMEFEGNTIENLKSVRLISNMDHAFAFKNECSR